MPDLAEFDAIFSKTRPFADSTYIQDQMHKAFEARLLLLSKTIESAGQLLRVLSCAGRSTRYRVIGDPAIRVAIQHALWRVITGNDMPLSQSDSDEVLTSAVAHVRRGIARSPLESSARLVSATLGSPDYTAWIWTNDRREDVFGRAFEKVVQHEYGESLCTPLPEDVAALQTATKLLETLSPLLAHSALSHVHLVGVFAGTGNWEKVASSSQFRITGAIFLNRTTFKNPWWLAEHLLHESLHQKFYDFRHAHSVLAADEAGKTNGLDETARVVSLWNTPGLDGSNQWDPHRALAAFHVYVHLAYFCMLAEQRANEFRSIFGPLDVPPVMTDSRRALDRAHYLGEQLRIRCSSELGLAGQQMVDWFSSAIDFFDPCRPPFGAFVHLLLDRYTMEAAKIQQNPSADRFANELAKLSKIEIQDARRIFAGMDRNDEAERFSTDLEALSDIDQLASFVKVRQIIAEHLGKLTMNTGTLRKPSSCEAKCPEELLRELVETSSIELARMGAISTRVPRQVAA